MEIDSNTSIDRGALSDTIIDSSTKIYNLCHITHNVIIVEQTIITAHADIPGSVKIGNNVWIGLNSTLIGYQIIGAGSIVLGDVQSN